jgi:glycosyltransferase involved in cell wall biosynthesis
MPCAASMCGAAEHAQPALRLLYIHQHFSTPDGSVGNRSWAFARAAIARGHIVTMLCGGYVGAATGLDGAFQRGRREGVVDGIRVIELAAAAGNAQSPATRAARFGRFALAASMVAARERADLVYATSTPLSVALPALAARCARGRPYVFEVRDLWPELPVAMGVIRNPAAIAALSGLEWAAYRGARAVVALSDGMATGVARRGVPPYRIAVIPNGCDLELFSPAVPPAETPWLGAGEVAAIYAGAHGRANGLDHLLEVAAELRGTPLRLVLCGDGSEKPRLRARAAAMQLDNVTFLDPVPRRAMPALLRACAIGIQSLADVPAFQEGTSPNKLMDYLAAGLPVAITYPGWAARLLQAEGAGIAPPRAPQEFAAALLALAREEPRRRGMGQAARRLAEARFDRGQLAAQFVAVIEAAHQNRRQVTRLAPTRAA